MRRTFSLQMHARRPQLPQPVSMPVTTNGVIEVIAGKDIVAGQLVSQADGVVIGTALTSAGPGGKLEVSIGQSNPAPAPSFEAVEYVLSMLEDPKVKP